MPAVPAFVLFHRVTQLYTLWCRSHAALLLHHAYAQELHGRISNMYPIGHYANCIINIFSCTCCLSEACLVLLQHNQAARVRTYMRQRKGCRPCQRQCSGSLCMLCQPAAALGLRTSKTEALLLLLRSAALQIRLRLCRCPCSAALPECLRHAVPGSGLCTQQNHALAAVCQSVLLHGQLASCFRGVLDHRQQSICT